MALKNDTPYKVNSARIEYCDCDKDENNFIASGGTWTADTYRGGCLVTEIHSTLIINGREKQCKGYFSSGTGISEFYIMWIDDACCLRSSQQSNTECPNPTLDFYPRVKIKNDTPFQSYNVIVEYGGCKDDKSSFIASGGTWTAETYRGSCGVNKIYARIINEYGDKSKSCTKYSAFSTSYSEFYIIFINERCCVRSWKETKECPGDEKQDLCAYDDASGSGFRICKCTSCATADHGSSRILLS